MKLKIFLVAFIIAAQVAAIFCVSFARERERALSPTFRFECSSFDPRDLLRGHYLPLSFRVNDDIPFSKLDKDSRERLLERFKKWEKEVNPPRRFFSGSRRKFDLDYWFVLAPNPKTGFWEIETVKTTAPAEAERAGKLVLEVLCEGDSWKSGLSFESATSKITPESLRVSPKPLLPRMRFYLPEKNAKRFDKYVVSAENPLVVSADVYRRADGTFHLKTLFIGNVPANDFLENLPEK